MDEDVDNDGKTVEMNVRFPGQYYDAESGLHYNYFRTYDPELGRYLTSDPIGLAGGLNTFGYVGGNPVGYVDLYGLYDVVTSAGFSFPVFPGFTYDHSVGSIIRDAQSGVVHLESTGHKVTNTLGEVIGAGVSIGMSNLNEDACGENWTANIGLSKYTGLSITFLQQQDYSKSIFNPTRYIDGFTINLGLGLGLPVTITDNDI